jgi:adenylate kinase
MDFLFDGFPRTVAQAEALDKLLAQKGTSIAIVLALPSQRGRADQKTPEPWPHLRPLRRQPTKQTIRSRHAEYEKKTAAVADYYEKYGKVIYRQRRRVM